MKMNTKKTISAVLALILSAAVLTTGCGKAEDTGITAADTSCSEEISYTEDAPAEENEIIVSAALTRAELEAKNSWNETQINEVMYTTQACYSRKIPAAGAETVSKYKKGTKVTVVAATDTGYYKLKDGSYIHSSFLSDTKPGAATTKTAAMHSGKWLRKYVITWVRRKPGIWARCSRPDSSTTSSPKQASRAT